MVSSKGRAEDTHFLNVDLDIYSTRDIQPLVTALGTKVLVLRIGRTKRTYGAHLAAIKLTKNARDHTGVLFSDQVPASARASTLGCREESGL
jgi:hypothetical protein